jgi:hypothetical protein
MKKQNVDQITNVIAELLGKLLAEVMGNRKAVDLVNDMMIALNKISDTFD